MPGPYLWRGFEILERLAVEFSSPADLPRQSGVFGSRAIGLGHHADGSKSNHKATKITKTAQRIGVSLCAVFVIFVALWLLLLPLKGSLMLISNSD